MMSLATDCQPAQNRNMHPTVLKRLLVLMGQFTKKKPMTHRLCPKGETSAWSYLIGHWATTYCQHSLYRPWYRIYQHLEFFQSCSQKLNWVHILWLRRPWNIFAAMVIKPQREHTCFGQGHCNSGRHSWQEKNAATWDGDNSESLSKN